jgi:hypothetical protein
MWPFRKKDLPAAGMSSGRAEHSGRAWMSLPPIQRSMDAPDLTIAPKTFEDSLASRRPPQPFLGPLGHVLSESAPSGLVSGLISPAPGGSQPPPDRALLPLADLPAPAQSDFSVPRLSWPSTTTPAPVVSRMQEPGGEHVSVQPMPETRLTAAPSIDHPVLTLPAVPPASGEAPSTEATPAAETAPTEAMPATEQASLLGESPVETSVAAELEPPGQLLQAEDSLVELPLPQQPRPNVPSGPAGTGLPLQRATLPSSSESDPPAKAQPPTVSGDFIPPDPPTIPAVLPTLGPETSRRPAGLGPPLQAVPGRQAVQRSTGHEGGMATGSPPLSTPAQRTESGRPTADLRLQRSVTEPGSLQSPTHPAGPPGAPEPYPILPLPLSAGTTLGPGAGDHPRISTIVTSAARPSGESQSELPRIQSSSDSRDPSHSALPLASKATEGRSDAQPAGSPQDLGPAQLLRGAPQDSEFASSPLADLATTPESTVVPTLGLQPTLGVQRAGDDSIERRPSEAIGDSVSPELVLPSSTKDRRSPEIQAVPAAAPAVALPLVSSSPIRTSLQRRAVPEVSAGRGGGQPQPLALPVPTDVPTGRTVLQQGSFTAQRRGRFDLPAAPNRPGASALGSDWATVSAGPSSSPLWSAGFSPGSPAALTPPTQVPAWGFPGGGSPVQRLETAGANLPVQRPSPPGAPQEGGFVQRADEAGLAGFGPGPMAPQSVQRWPQPAPDPVPFATVQTFEPPPPGAPPVRPPGDVAVAAGIADGGSDGSVLFHPPSLQTAPDPAPPPSAGGSKSGDLDELARKLYPKMRPYLRKELWLDRERAGLIRDSVR